MKKVIIRKDSYYDSIILMEINSKLKRIDGVKEVVVAMATAQNRQLIANLGFDGELAAATAGDLVIALSADDESLFESVPEKLDELLHSSRKARREEGEYRPSNIKGAVEVLPGANLAVVSVAGDYAWYEAKKALDRGLHVMLFSDNVPVEKEIELKKLSTRKGLLVMGPDCGTAIINAVPLCFANEVRRGAVGIVGASGTGIQEVTVLIDRLGGGISQAIGTGGRDLTGDIGGLTCLQGIEALRSDPETKVILVISKPPDEKVSRKIVASLASAGKPAVVHFIGSGFSGDGSTVKAASNLQEAAVMAVEALEGKEMDSLMFSLDTEEMERIVKTEAEKKSREQKFIRGYFTGGTLCDEALFILSKDIEPVLSNIHPDKSFRLKDPFKSEGHSLVDLGDDRFTSGRPHPMIDPLPRAERIRMESDDARIAVMMLDIMLGYGSHPDPAGAMLPAIVEAKKRAGKRKGPLTVIAAVVGTERDFQNYRGQRKKLEENGVIVTESNAQMAKLALRILRRARSPSGPKRRITVGPAGPAGRNEKT